MTLKWQLVLYEDDFSSCDIRIEARGEGGGREYVQDMEVQCYCKSQQFMWPAENIELISTNGINKEKYSQAIIRLIVAGNTVPWQSSSKLMVCFPILRYTKLQTDTATDTATAAVGLV